MWMLGMVWDFFAVLLHASAAAACRRHGACAFTGQNVGAWLQAEIAQLVARMSRNPKVVSSILTFRMDWHCLVSCELEHSGRCCGLGPRPSAVRADTTQLRCHGHGCLGDPG